MRIPAFVLTVHAPAARLSRYRPCASVVTCRRDAPWVNVSLTWAAGLVQGTPALHTGIVGPIRTEPWMSVSATRSSIGAHTVARGGPPEGAPPRSSRLLL